MSAQATAPTTVDLFKKCYGKLHELQPADFPLARDIPWNDGMKVGDEFIESVVLSNEVGITLGGSGADIFEIDPAIAGAVKQTKVRPYVTVLPSIIPWAVISRSAGGGEKAFFAGTKHLVKNNLRSHGKFHEILRWYGQATGGLGYVSYATATYRSVSFTNGAGTLVSSVYGSKAFTAGINAASKLILLQPGTFAAGHWVGMKGVRIEQVATSDNSVAAAGSLVSFDAKLGILCVDFTPIAASSATSHKIVLKGMRGAGEMIGIQKILSTVGTLFDIDNTSFELFRGNVSAVTGKLTLAKVNAAIADAVNQGELEGDLDLYVNPRTWGTMSSDEASLRKYDANYDENEATNGFKNIVYYSQNGRVTIKAHSSVKEGDSFGLMLETWSRSGSAEISMTVPGAPQDIIFPLQNQSGWAYRSFSDQYVFCYRPSWNIYFSGINDEAAS